MVSPLKSLGEEANALCYVWLACALVIASAVCFATASSQNNLLFPAILLLLAGVICVCLYLLRCAFKRKGSCQECCCSSCSSCCSCCCDCYSCCRTVLCLPPTETASFLDGASQHEEAARPTQSASEERNDAPADVTQVALNHDDTRDDKLQDLEHELKRLRQQYDFLQRQQCVDEVVEQNYKQLQTEEVKLSSWKEDHAVPTELDLKTMKGRLKLVARQFRLARSRIHAHDTGTNAGSLLEVNMDAPEQVRIFSQDVPVPPEYSETDPQPDSTRMYRQTRNAQTSHPYTIPTPEYTISSQAPIARPPPALSTDGHDNAAFLPDPIIESPPAYEQCTASPI